MNQMFSTTDLRLLPMQDQCIRKFKILKAENIVKTNTWETANTFTFMPIRIPKHIYNLCWQHNDITKKQMFD